MDRATGEIVKWEPYASQSPGRRLRTWSRWIHTGEAGGVIGQTVAGLVSAGAVVLVWTGIALAWRRLVPAGLRKKALSRPAEPAVSIQGSRQESHDLTPVPAGIATAASSHSSISSFVIFCQDSPALMVAPSSANLEVPGREPLPSKAQGSNQAQGSAVFRLNVGFDAVQLHLPEGMPQQEP